MESHVESIAESLEIIANILKDHKYHINWILSVLAVFLTFRAGKEFGRFFEVLAHNLSKM